MTIKQLSSSSAKLNIEFDERSSDEIRGGRKEGYETEAYGHQKLVKKRSVLEKKYWRYF